MTTTRPHTGPPGYTESPRPWRDTLEQVTEGLLDLISYQPNVSEHVGPLVKLAMRLRGQIEELEAKQRHDDYLLGSMAVSTTIAQRRVAPSRQWIAAPLADATPLQSVQKQYRVDDHNLKEVTTSPQGETTLQINFDYYVRVADALEQLAKARAVQSGTPAGIAARRIVTQTTREKPDKQVRGESVSLTHVYICLRFWMDADIIERPIRGQFRPADHERSFTEVAIETWKQLAAQTI